MSQNTSSINPPTIFICTTCGADRSVPKDHRCGKKLLDALMKVKDQKDFPARIQSVNCFGGCNHPCAIGFAQDHKITYIYGNIPVDLPTIDDTIAQIRTYAHQYAASKTGYIPAVEKPDLFKNVLMRVPDSNWHSATGIVTEKSVIDPDDEINPGNAILQQADE